ncbi:glucose-1-phosphate adenylyltransferase [Desulfoferrobacter suflitae]|uniref:glucose-1-phosphate adenylyltransferase n=1 Tax=Desulfoferrobacter suflitae TaxID=2865782 RepID=UPI002164D1F4|nr:glucose-1-phosphate adenylyltransferase [Desulfoferrobacter suflitae]MCK8600394.1 glucose-1-phosphate adenylyltransferase [Desulfoferrobacter suflitae]
MKDVLTIIMAGGRGTRLMPLTLDRSKPAVPFGGIYRLIDIPLSNCINSQLYKILIFPQYKSQSMVDHLEDGWNIFSSDLGHYLRIVGPQQRMGAEWYRGTADSVRHNLYLIERERPRLVLILSGDHVYKMDYSQFRIYHEENDADITVGLLEVDRGQASEFGIAEVDNDFKIRAWEEKPREPKSIPDDPDRSLASMGIYLFKTEVLLKMLKETDFQDFGKDIIPKCVEELKVLAYPYRRLNRIRDYIHMVGPDGVRRLELVDGTRDSQYWRDVGTLDAYWNANMDLTGVDPFFNLYGSLWPIRTYQRQYPPAKFVFNQRNGDNPPRIGMAVDSMVAPGCIISGGIVRSSVLSYNVMVRSWAEVDESVIMDGVEIGRNCRIKKAIIDKDNVIPPHTQIGIDPQEDRQNFEVTPRGIVTVPKGHFTS